MKDDCQFPNKYIDFDCYDHLVLCSDQTMAGWPEWERHRHIEAMAMYEMHHANNNCFPAIMKES